MTPKDISVMIETKLRPAPEAIRDRFLNLLRTANSCAQIRCRRSNKPGEIKQTPKRFTGRSVFHWESTAFLELPEKWAVQIADVIGMKDSWSSHSFMSSSARTLQCWRCGAVSEADARQLHTPKHKGGFWTVWCNLFYTMHIERTWKIQIIFHILRRIYTILHKGGGILVFCCSSD